MARKKGYSANQPCPPEWLELQLKGSTQLKKFNIEEQLAFIIAYKITPKDFGRIASVVPGRTAQECVRYYYANKSNKRFKLQSKAERDEEKGTKEMYLLPPADADQYVEESSDVDGSISPRNYWLKNDIVPIDAEIVRLLKLISPRARLPGTKSPPRNQIPLRLPMPDLCVFRAGFDLSATLSDCQICVWFRSAKVLPFIKQWKIECFDNATLRTESGLWMRHFLEKPNILDRANFFGARKVREMDFTGPFPRGLYLTAKHAYVLARGLDVDFKTQFQPSVCSRGRCRAAALMALLTAYLDLRNGPESFFSILCETPMASMIVASARVEWERLYLIPGEKLVWNAYKAPNTPQTPSTDVSSDQFEEEDIEHQGIFDHTGEEEEDSDYHNDGEYSDY